MERDGHLKPPEGWLRLLSWRFDGVRANGDGCDIRDLKPLFEMRDLLVDLSGEIFRQRHPRGETTKEQRAKDGEAVEIRILGFERGSCVIPVFSRERRAMGLLGEFDPRRFTLGETLPDAALSVRRAMAGDIEAPGLSKGRLEKLRRITDVALNLGARSIQLTVPFVDAGQYAVPDPEPLAIDVTPELGDRLDTMIKTMGRKPKTKERPGWITEGAVIAVNRKLRTAVLEERKTRKPIDLTFSLEHEAAVIKAFAEHETHTLRVRGSGWAPRNTDVTSVDLTDVWAREKPGPETLCEERFRELAIEAPDDLLEMLPKLEPSLLTFAAEVIGELLPEEVAVAPLLGLLDSPSQVVREGATLGLGHHVSNKEVRAKLVYLALHERNDGVREAAEGALE